MVYRLIHTCMPYKKFLFGNTDICSNLLSDLIFDIKAHCGLYLLANIDAEHTNIREKHLPLPFSYSYLFIYPNASDASYNWLHLLSPLSVLFQAMNSFPLFTDFTNPEYSKIESIISFCSSVNSLSEKKPQ